MMIDFDLIERAFRMPATHNMLDVCAARDEFAKLRKMIEDAPIGTVILDERETQIISCDFPEGTRVALVKVED